ncbi:MAG: M48 family metalloprotease [Leptospiraceae bacterium]|nr:M48 family metalloprotease [Leptospiraceae bacterium]
MNLRVVSFLFLVYSIFFNSCKSTASKELGAPPPSSIKEVQTGKALAAKLAKKYGLIQDKDFTTYLTLVGRSISQNSSRSELNFHFGILNTDEVNAFACPGGYILVTKGALKLADSEAELAALLSHEVTHVSLKHYGKFEEQQGASILDIIASIMAPGGNVVTSLTNAAVDGAMALLFEKGLPKEQEYEADKGGVTYMSLAGYDANSAVTYLEKMNSSQNKSTLNKTHPPTSERVTLIKNYIRSQGFDPKGAKGKTRFQAKLKEFLAKNDKKVSYNF